MVRPIVTCMLFGVFAVISGCGGYGTSSPVEPDSVTLSGMWQVESIDQGGIIDNSMITIEFDDDNRIVGSTGCNRYSGLIAITDDNITVSNILSTRKACAPAMMMQEQRFLAALNEITHYQISLDTWLIVADHDNNERLKLIQIKMNP